jgi:hypothetical protein
MDSQEAAAVRDAINGCPDVVNEDDHIDYGSAPFETTKYGEEVTIGGEFVEPSPSKFKPATIEQSGTLGNGDGAERPVYVVVLETVWLNNDDVRCLSSELVYEIAKHDCKIRFYPPDHRLGGDVWITDHFSQRVSDSNGDRCPDCGSTYFKIRDGEPECAKCGATEESVQTTLTEAKA